MILHNQSEEITKKPPSNIDMPNFLIIGAGKCGTTSLDNYLKQHPEIFIPEIKEPNFFGYELMTEADFRENPQELIHFRNSVTTIDDYQKLFEPAMKGQVKGETSNTYLYHKYAPEGIYNYNKDIKLIAIFRQPADRLWSRYLHLSRESRLPTQDFSECLNRNSIWWERNDLINEGFYFKNLSPYYELFNPSQIRVYLFEELKNNGEKVLEDIFGFLGVDTTFKVDMSVRYNKSGIIKNTLFDKIIGNHGLIPGLTRTIMGNSYQKLKQSSTLQKLITSIRSKNLAKPSIDPGIRKILTNDIYCDDIRKLSKLTGKNLQHWID